MSVRTRMELGLPARRIAPRSAPMHNKSVEYLASPDETCEHWT
ncbi:hypothetical protein NY08_3072 [Rhodococcus sp. B7740]|nr:hypothetical protein NY08_3072 [Rhodococcus sp. B7740]